MGEVTSCEIPMVNPATQKLVEEANKADPISEPAPAIPQAPAGAGEQAPQPQGTPAESSALAPASAEELEDILQPYQQELSSTGKLSEESIGKLSQELHIPQDIIRYTYEGMKAVSEQRNSAILSEAGGSEAYQAMVRWGSTTYSEDALETFNKAVLQGTKEEALVEIRKLKQKFTEVNGSFQPRIPPKSLPTVPAASTGHKPSMVAFANMSELMAAQRDPRYGKDPKYTQWVYNRAAISKI